MPIYVIEFSYNTQTGEINMNGIEINWTLKKYAVGFTALLGGFAIIIGWFNFTLFLMGA